MDANEKVASDKKEEKVKETKELEGDRRCHFYRTAFYSKVHPTGGDTYQYSQVRKWTKTGVPGNSIFSCEALFFPCNIGDMHWIVIVAFMKAKSIQVFDSLGGNHESGVLAIYQYLQDEHRNKFNEAMKDEREWKLYAENPLASAQKNGYDCGVFVCMYADYISNGWPLVFNQTHIKLCRERIALGILQNCAVTSGAAVVVLDDLWNMRNTILFAVEMYRPELLKWMDAGDLPEDDSMGLYWTKQSKREYGKVAFRVDTLRDNLVRSIRIQEQQERERSITKDEKLAWEADKAAKRLAREARRLNNDKRVKEVAQLERQHFKREMKADELTSFIATMEKRLYLSLIHI